MARLLGDVLTTHHHKNQHVMTYYTGTDGSVVNMELDFWVP
jgi:hypothetical protein